MPEKKWKSPLEDWEENNQDPNLVFTLVARNEGAKQMWADPYNSSRYVPASFTRKGHKDQSMVTIKSAQDASGDDDGQPRPKIRKETEPALRFRFSDWPKSFAKGYVLGSDDKVCDALLGDPGHDISQQMLAFTFNKYHELIMNVTSDNPTSVTFNAQKEARRTNFTWIFPHDQRLIRVNVADVLEFDVVVPKYGINKEDFHKNRESFLSSAAHGDLLAGGLGIDSKAGDGQASGTSSPWRPFYLRGKRLGSGSYGDVYKVLRMPDGKIFAAKKFNHKDSFRQEVDMLKRVCETSHINIVQFVEEWHGDYRPLLIMEYVAGGNLLQQMKEGMSLGEIKNLANQTLAALVFLHNQEVMHRDIKPANILCVSRCHYKLADFGVSKEVAPLLSKQGTAEYMAPEVHDLAPYSYPADIWSLGVVLFECMDDLPVGRPGKNGRRWCEIVLSNFTRYYSDIKGSDAFVFILLIKNAMLRMNSTERLSARRCLEGYGHLWEDLGRGDHLDAGNGVHTPTQAHSNRSFVPDSLGTSECDDTEEATSIIVGSNGEDRAEKGREVRMFRNEDRTTVVHDKARTAFQSGLYPGPPSIGGGQLYDPAHEFASVPSMSESGMHGRSTSDGNIKRRRDSHTSAEGADDGSVTPGRRAPYRPGHEVAAPGIDYIPANPWVRDSHASAEGDANDGSVTPGRRAPYRPGNEVAAPGIGYVPANLWTSSRRNSHTSGGANDGSVTPGRRAPYRPGNEVAAPGIGYIPPNLRASSPGPDDGSVTPGRRAPYHPGNEVAAPGIGYIPANLRPGPPHKRSKSSNSNPTGSATQGRPITKSQSSNLTGYHAKDL